jgi:hypothetical protein
MLRPTVQSASLSWCEAPIWGLRSDFYYRQTVADLLIWGALSDERTVCHSQLLLALASTLILRSESCGTRDHILLSQVWDFPFWRLLRLAGSRWRYSTPSPHGIDKALNLVSLITSRHGLCTKHRPRHRLSVSRWLPIAAARVQSRVWSSGICGGQSGAGAGFLRVLRFPLSIIIPPNNSPSSQSPGAGTIGQ